MGFHQQVRPGGHGLVHLSVDGVAEVSAANGPISVSVAGGCPIRRAGAPATKSFVNSAATLASMMKRLAQAQLWPAFV